MTLQFLNLRIKICSGIRLSTEIQTEFFMHLFTNTNEHIDECRVATQTRLVHFVNQLFATQGKQSTLCNGNLRVYA